MEDAIVLIATERNRQRSNWSDTHDDEHDKGELIAAAACYASLAQRQITGALRRGVQVNPWPFSDGWKPKPDPITNLTIAAALIAAEIDRIQRERARAVPRQGRPIGIEA